jgi:tRNA-specific 2-thiouridylase
MARDRVVVAMSGGVDSSVAALLLAQEGYEVVGVTLRLWSGEESGEPAAGRGCCTIEDIDDARRVCQMIGARHYLVNAEREFRTFVVDYFVREYQRGRTPHPCILCNDRIKFDFLLQRALLLGADYVATGHYARTVTEPDGEARLLRSLDPAKDQSYVLFGLGQARLRRLRLPLGWHTKEEVRGLARAAGLPVAEKPDSQDVCFIPPGGYGEFLQARVSPTPGEVVDSAGRVLGRHPGVEFFTVGQRRGLGFSSLTPMYVIRLEPETRQVVVGPEEELYAPGLRAQEVRWIRGRPPQGTVSVDAKIRYKASEAPATLVADGDGALVWFEKPQRAVTPGQAVVFYQGAEVLGGGFIQGPVYAMTQERSTPN